MDGIPAVPLSTYRAIPQGHYGESLAFPVDEAAWNPYNTWGGYGYPYGGYLYGGYGYGHDYYSYLHNLHRVDRQQKLDEYDQQVRDKSTKELKKIQEHRERIDEILKNAKEKQLELEGELQGHQTMNKQLINQMTMLRDNEFLRERLAHKEFDKIDRATEKIEDKASDLAKYKDYLGHYYPPLSQYHPTYMTPKIHKTTKIVEKEPT